MMIIFLVILLVFGAKRIPEIARGLGHGIREFKQATREISRELTLEQESPSYARRPSDPHTISRASAGAMPAPEPPPAPGPSKASSGEASG